MNKVLSLFILIFSINVGYGQSSKNENINTLLQLTKSTDVPGAILDNLIYGFQEKKSNIPNSFWDSIRVNTDRNDYLNEVAQLYDKYYTEEEVLQLVNFYSSSLGKKVIEIQPLMTTQVYNFAIKWENKLKENIYKELSNNGYFFIRENK